MMSCKSVQPMLDAYRTNELGDDERMTVETHLPTCPECTNELQAMRGLAARLKQFRTIASPAIAERVAAALGDRIGRVSTALGDVWIAFNDRGISLLSLDQASEGKFAATCLQRLGRQVTLADVPERLARSVQGAASGEWSADVAVDLSAAAPFERAVLEKLRGIPKGEVRPYAWLAAEAGSPRAVRAVGNIMHRNPVPLILPCHRVVPSGGGVGDYAYGPEIKRALLTNEGVAPERLEDLARRKVRYIGSDTTRIYCYPTCRDARRIRPEHQVNLASELAASDSGFRPCLHCRPLAVAV